MCYNSIYVIIRRLEYVVFIPAKFCTIKVRVFKTMNKCPACGNMQDMEGACEKCGAMTETEVTEETQEGASEAVTGEAGAAQEEAM